MRAASELHENAARQRGLPRAQVGETQIAATVDPSPVVGGDETVSVVEDNAPLRRSAAGEA